MGNWQRDKNSNRETKPSRRVWTPKLLPENTLQSSECSPSTRGGQIPEAMGTVRNCTRGELRSSVLRLWKPPGRRNLQSSRRDQRGNFLSGSVCDQARRPAILKLLKARKKHLQRRRLKRTRRRRNMMRKRRRRSKLDN